MQLTHLDENNRPKMVDVSDKNPSFRLALAGGKISMSKEAFMLIKTNTAKKGPVLDTAVIAAIMGAKQTSNLIPMCHPLNLSKVNVDINELEAECAYELFVSVKCEGKTGVEMEALSAVSIGLLTIYDMVKAVDKAMIISDIELKEKKKGERVDCILNNKPKIDYPCTWDYKVILAAKTDAKSLFEELLGENKYKCERGNSSKAGKYESYLLSIRVENEEHRLRLFELLKKHSKYLI